ncbi:MAG: winged helix-turn-helix domain-containing protein [Candidatus Acidiferrum sp.]
MVHGTLYSFGSYILDAERMVLSSNGRIVSIPPKALKTLLTLVERAGIIVSKQELMEEVWPDSFVEEGNLTQNIFLLRRELGRTVEDEDYIQTLPKRGYRITVPVQIISPKSQEGQAPKTVSRVEAETDPNHRVTTALSRRGEVPRSIRMLFGAFAIVALMTLACGIEWSREIPRWPVASGFRQITNDGAIKRLQAAQLGGPEASLFTDGTRVYFIEGSSDAPIVAEASAMGSETNRVSMPMELPSLLDVSRSRSEFLVAGYLDPADPPPLWAVPFPAGTPRRLNGITAWDAAWSPDGHSLAYVRGRELFLANGDGSGSRRLASLPGNGWQPRWSPDGKRLRLTIFDIQRWTSSLWEVSSEGEGLRPLLRGWRPAGTPTGEPVDICCGVWSPDGNDFVFQVTVRGRSDVWWLPGNDGWLRKMVHGSVEPVRVTAGQLNSIAPAFSPDGRNLFVIGQDVRGELQKFDSRVGQFVSYMGGISANFVDFSRDGQWLLYVTYPEGTLWRARTDGSQKTQLSFSPLEVMVPRWSPDGRQIIFHAIGGDRQGASLIPAEGGEPRPVSVAGGEMQPSWSPDGAAIMYSDFPFFSDHPERVAVYILHLKTGNIDTLPDSGGLFAPQWSPDGKYATALGLKDQRIMLFDFAEKTWSSLASGWGLVRWSADSRSVYYLRYGPHPAVMRVSVPDRQIEQVASLEGIRLSGRLAGLEFGLTPDREPIITRAVGTQEIYSMDWRPR